ncbi:hypothetical protein FRB97_003088 [Tulasnella sp. 331]|nr:hypothetical protein FRB97_003088 [Tulasnella sp. 331]
MFKSITLLGVLASTVVATSYNLVDNFVGGSFLTGFNWEAIPDPTHGAVNYTDQAFAIAQNLTYTSSDTLILRADYTHVTNYPTGPGRNSVRIRSNKEYTTAVTILDLRHMPQGCATWPAFWTTLESDWPDNGEVDIIEGVNDVSPNQSTLHTTAGCTMVASTMSQTGTTSQINIWFWARDDTSVPADVSSGAASVVTSSWGLPVANFVSTNCNFDHFGPQNIIINLTLCGDWAGAVYPSTCPSTCTNYVNTEPAAFENAYWDIAWLKVYE